MLILDAGTGIRTLGLDLAPDAADPHPAHPPAPRPHPGPDVLPALLPRRRRRSRSGARPRPRPRSRTGSRATSRRRSRRSRSASCRARSPSATRRRASGSSAARRSAPRRSPTAGRRSATGSPTATRPSPTSPTTSRRSARRSRASSPSGSRASTSPSDADLLIHDCQYTDEEYPAHVGWGHSAMTDTLTFADRVEAKRLLLFHHDPLHADEFLDDLEAARAQRLDRSSAATPTQIEMAMEGGELEVGRARCPACPRLSTRRFRPPVQAIAARSFDTRITQVAPPRCLPLARDSWNCDRRAHASAARRQSKMTKRLSLGAADGARRIPRLARVGIGSGAGRDRHS